jgi:hypothetical protein
MEPIQIPNLINIQITTQENNENQNGHALVLTMSDYQSASGVYLLLKDEKITLDYRHTFGRNYFMLLIQLQNMGKQFERIINIDNKNVDWMDRLFDKSVTHLFVCYLNGNGTTPVQYQQVIRL